MSKSSSKKQTESNHCFGDEELHCLIEARKIFQRQKEFDGCACCEKAWRLLDQAILAKYTTLAQEHYKETKDV